MMEAADREECHNILSQLKSSASQHVNVADVHSVCMVLQAGAVNFRVPATRAEGSASVPSNSVVRLDVVTKSIRDVQEKIREMGNDSSDIAGILAEFYNFLKDVDNSTAASLIGLMRKLWSKVSNVIKNYSATLAKLALDLDDELGALSMGNNVVLFVGPIWGEHEAPAKVQRYLESNNLTGKLHWTGEWWTPIEKWNVDSKAVFRPV